MCHHYGLPNRSDAERESEEELPSFLNEAGDVETEVLTDGGDEA